MIHRFGRPTERSGLSQEEYTWMRTVLYSLNRRGSEGVDMRIRALILKSFGDRIYGSAPVEPAEIVAHEVVVDMARQFYPDIPHPNASGTSIS